MDATPLAASVARISEPKSKGINRWKGDDEARRAFYNNQARLLSEGARQAFKLRAELVEPAFALTLDRGGMRGSIGAPTPIDGYLAATMSKSVIWSISAATISV